MPSTAATRGMRRCSFAICQPQMQQGIGLAHAINFRATRYLKAHMEIKAQRLSILFINIQCRCYALIYSVPQQSAPNALSTPFRVNEQHLDFPLGDSSETHNNAIFVTNTV